MTAKFNMSDFHTICHKLLIAYKDGDLGQTRMPEDSNPGFSDNDIELRIAYFTFPMALNYQRDSYKLWEAALKTFNDLEAKDVFDLEKAVAMNEVELRTKLLKHKLALQPNKHTDTWRKLASTVYKTWGGFENLLKEAGHDFLKLKELIQHKHKKDFPYLSGPKIFNYWSFILVEYGKVPLKNRDRIAIAPDTHITQCSVKLGLITEEGALKLTKDQISEKWRLALKDSGISPIQMHPPLWFWSRNGFIYEP